jgi:hypothetical protein
VWGVLGDGGYISTKRMRPQLRDPFERCLSTRRPLLGFVGMGLWMHMLDVSSGGVLHWYKWTRQHSFLFRCPKHYWKSKRNWPRTLNNEGDTM